jgi:hypothetical protein
VLSADTKEPVARLLVEAIRVTDSFNIATSVTTTSARTFADGGFSLDQLTPGQYFFRFTPATHPPLLIDDARDASRELQMQWWPGGDTPRNATPFTVMAGTKFRLPDIWMPSLPRFQVSGTIGPAICKPGDAYTVSIGEKHGSKIAVLRSTVVRCGTEFLLGDLAPGRYEISLLPQDGGDPVAHEDVIVTDRNLQRDFPPAQATP